MLRFVSTGVERSTMRRSGVGRGSRLVAVVGVLTLAMSAPAMAAPERPAPTALALEAMRNFGRCVVEASPAGPKGVLAMDFRTPAYRDWLNALGRGHGRCLNNNDEMRGAGVLFAGALAEGLLTSETRAPLAASLGGAVPIVSRSMSETMALCVVRADPAATANLIATTPASPEEERAFGSVSAQLPGCLAKGASVKLNRPGLRAIIALAAYRIAAANGAVRGVSVPVVGTP